VQSSKISEKSGPE